jgi:hypothetical protein
MLDVPDLLAQYYYPRLIHDPYIYLRSMDDNEKKYIEENRESTFKVVCFRLQEIREKYTGQSEEYQCFCKKTARKIWLKDFYEWYDALNQ